MSKLHDTPKCEKCGGRTALMSGYWDASPDQEPYMNGVEEDYDGSDVVVHVSGNVCDDCGHVQGLNYEGD